jgi:hypothetical protein
VLSPEVAEALAHRLSPSAWVKDRVGLDPDPWQADLLDAGGGEDIVIAARQVGKSAAASWLAAHTLVHNPNEVVIVGAPSLRQSSEMVRRVREVLETAGEKLLVSNAYSLELRNRARLVAVPGGEEGVAARGFTATMLVFDEAAYISDAVLQSLRPMVATRPQARIVSISSAGMTRGWFYEMARQPPPHLRQHSIVATDHPRISVEFLERERLVMGERKFRQEYMNEWAASGSGFFSEQAMAHLFGGVAEEDEPPDPVLVRRPFFTARL